MPKTKAQIIAEAQVVKNETQVGANTATRVGGVLEDLAEKINEYISGKFYGYAATSADLPEGDEVGYAYVGSSPFEIWNFDGATWSDSGVTIANAPVPNMEDINYNTANELQFADRVYNSITPDGLGYKILRKSSTFAAQVTGTNTIYEIRYEFDLAADFTMPDKCELRFNGGSIKGNSHTLTMTRTRVSGDGRFVNCNFSGTITNESVRLSWFTDGMSSVSDYTTDYSSELIAAMKLTSCKRRGWLELERIPICIKQTIVITEDFGNIGMRNGLIYFLSSANKQALFDYQQGSSYSGNYSPIVDCMFYDVGDNYDTCVIKKTNWSDTKFTFWRDIEVIGFTGYFLVTNSYIQECTFENISVSGAGMFTTNSDNLYTGGYGSGNVLNFLNCNINNGETNSKTNIKSLYDLSSVIEATIHNAVCQGKIGGSNIYPIYIGHSTSDMKRNTLELDGLWVEFTTASVLNAIKVENTSAWVLVKRNSPTSFEIINSNLTIRAQQKGGMNNSALFSGINADTTSNVTLIVDSAAYQTSLMGAQYAKFKSLIDDGILRIIESSTPPYGNGATQTGVSITLRPTNWLDMISIYANTKMTSNKVASRNIEHKFGQSNGVPTLVFENTGASTYYDFTFMGNLGTLMGGNYETYVARSIWVEVIYRATVLVDVTSENVNEVICSGRGFLNAGGGAWKAFITPTAGMTAGTTTGWVRLAWCEAVAKASFTTGQNLQIRNTRLEIAKFIIARRNVDLTEDVFIDGNGTLQRTDRTPKVYQLPISSVNDTASYMSTIINDCPATFDTAKNVYKYADGSLQSLVKSSSVSSIVKLTQVEYDAIANKDNNTLYVII